MLCILFWATRLLTANCGQKKRWGPIPNLFFLTQLSANPRVSHLCFVLRPPSPCLLGHKYSLESETHLSMFSIFDTSSPAYLIGLLLTALPSVSASQSTLPKFRNCTQTLPAVNATYGQGWSVLHFETVCCSSFAHPRWCPPSP